MAIPGVSGEDFLTIDDVAARLGVDRKKVRVLTKNGSIQPLAGVGGELVYRVREIERYEREKANPCIMNITQIALYYRIPRRKAENIFNRRYKTLHSAVDPKRGMLYDLSRPIHRYIEAKHKLTPRRGDNGAITFTIDG